MTLEELIKRKNRQISTTRVIDLKGKVYKIHNHEFEKGSIDFRLL